MVDALSTLAFGYPKRAEFFRRELAEFLLLTREERIEPDSALGPTPEPWVCPSSYRAVIVLTRWISTGTASATFGTVRLTLSEVLQPISRNMAGEPVMVLPLVSAVLVIVMKPSWLQA